MGEFKLPIVKNKRNGQLVVFLQRKRMKLRRKSPRFMIINDKVKFLD